MKLKQVQSDKPSFFHHYGMSSSQIDYIIYCAENGFIFDYKIHERCPINTSSHVPVSTKSVLRLTGSQITKVNFNTRYKIEWDNLDSEAFNALITNELFMYNMEEKTSEDNINFLCRCLKRATTAAVPSKVIKLKGHKFKASPTVLHLLKICKEKYQLWKNNGKHNDSFKSDKSLAQRNLRRQLRKEQYTDRTNFYNEVMDNPSNDMFHTLIRRSRNSRNKEAACIIENGEHHYNVIDQTNIFTRFFEDLAIPKDKGYDSEFLELCNIRHNVIQQMCE